MIKFDISDKVKGEQFQKLICEKGSSLVLEKTKELLETNIKRLQEELEYVKDKLTKTTKKLQETRKAAWEIESAVVETTKMVSYYRKEKEDEEKESEKLKDVEKKALLMEERKPVIKSKIETVQELSQRQQDLHQRYQETVRKKDKSDEALTATRASLKSIEEEILILKDRSLISQLPSYRDLDDLKLKQAEAAEDKRRYETDIEAMQGKLSETERELASYKKEAEERTIEEKRLSSQKKQLQDKVKELESVKDSETLSAETEVLKKEKQRLTDDIENRKIEKKRLESALIEVGRSIEEERQFESTAEQRLKELKDQKEKIDNADTVMKRINLDITVNKKFHDIINSITEYIGPLNKTLDGVAEDYKKVHHETRQAIEKVLR